MELLVPGLVLCNQLLSHVTHVSARIISGLRFAREAERARCME